METELIEVTVDMETLHREINDLKTAVESLDKSIRGDTENNPGLIGRTRSLEDWKKSREAFESKVTGALITMALTGLGTLILAFVRLTGIKL